MTTPDDLTPGEAERLLAAADTGIDRGDSFGGRSRIGAGLSIGIGALVSAMFLAGVYVLPDASWQLALIVSGGYAVGIIAATTIYNRYRRVTPTGWMRRYRLGLAISIGVFAVVLALSFLIPERSPLLWVPLAIAAGLPLGILGSLTSRR